MKNFVFGTDNAAPPLTRYKSPARWDRSVQTSPRTVQKQRRTRSRAAMASYQILGSQPVYNPTIPYVAEIQGGCHPGMVFTITGTVPAKMERFFVNFSTGQSEGADVAFHFNPRTDGRDKIVCNTFKNGSWGKEDRSYDMPFKKQKDFKLTFEITKFTYQVAVNDKLVVDYKHLIDLERVLWFQIKGDIQINSITVTGGRGAPQGVPQGYPQGPYGY